MVEKAAAAVGCGGGGGEKKEEEEGSLMEGVAVLDFDMLCTTVAMQTQLGKWKKLNGEEEESSMVYPNGGGAFRMWEGELLYDFFDDRRLAFQSSCCPCYRFGKNMRRAGLGSCFLQGSVYLILVLIALFNLLAYAVTERRCFVYLAVVFMLSVGVYTGFYRSLIRKRFNIRDNGSSLDDCIYHLICPCCSLGQESRTLEMNNVEDGIWHGRGDTICIGSCSEGSNAFVKPYPHGMAITAPDLQSISKATNDSSHLGS